VKYISLIDLGKELKSNQLSVSKQVLNLPEIMNHPNYDDIKSFVLNQNEKTKVFNGWIEQNQPLKKLLTLGTTTDFFSDNQNWKQHAFFNQFKSYVSPFFTLILERKNTVQISNEWAKIFSFFVLMDDETRYFIEQTLYFNIKQSIDKKLRETQENISESDFHQILLFLLSEDSIKIHNSLSRASHTNKITFIEQILQLVYHPNCSAKTAHWMVLSLEKMELCFEQKESLKRIKEKIKKREIGFSNGDQINKLNRKRNFIFALFSAFLMGILIYLFNQETDVNAAAFKELSALQYFSIEERKEIDSILKSMALEQTDSLNTGYFSTGNSITVQAPIINKLARNIYAELEEDMANHFLRIYDTCILCNSKKIIIEKINETAYLREIKSKNQIEIKNDSEYSFLFLAWVDSVNGAVYSGFLDKKSVFKINILNGMKLMLVPGNTYGAISNEFKSDFNYLTNHFCSIDFNYEFSIHKIYSVRATNNKDAKLLIEGAMGEVLILNDSNGILE
jgi:hypothetical protein